VSSTAQGPERLADQRAESLKERIYVTFTTLSVVIALQAHDEETSVSSAVLTLIVTVAGTLLAVFFADVLSHIVVRQHFPVPRELAHMLRVSLGAAPVLAAPLISLALVALDVWSMTVGLRVAMGVLLATLVLVGLLAVRRISLTFWQTLVVLVAELVLGVAVVALELLAHL
jgi:hypothetical protein